MRILALFVSCSLILAAQEPAQPDWRFAHPDAILVGAIRPKALIDSPILEEALKQGTSKEASSTQTMAMVNLVKGLLSEIKEVRFSVVQTGEHGKQKLDVVALIDGKFEEGILGLMMANTKSPNGTGTRRIDATTLLIGEGASLEQAAMRMTQSAPKLRSRAFEGAETLATNDLWISGRIPEDPFGLPGLLGAALPEMPLPPAADFTKNLRRIAFGLSLRDGVDGELVLQTAAPELAESLVKEALKTITQQPGAAMSRLIGARVEGATAHFTLNVPRTLALEEIRNAAQQRTRVVANANAPQPLEPPKPVRRTIVIQGLEEGTREVPLVKEPLTQETH